MKIVYDLAKDSQNVQKHGGVSLGQAVDFEWLHAVVWPDERQAYGEHRMIALGYIGNRLFNMVFVDRNGLRRVISLRKANRREEKRYAET